VASGTGIRIPTTTTRARGHAAYWVKPTWDTGGRQHMHAGPWPSIEHPASQPKPCCAVPGSGHNLSHLVSLVKLDQPDLAGSVYPATAPRYQHTQRLPTSSSPGFTQFVPPSMCICRSRPPGATTDLSASIRPSSGTPERAWIIPEGWVTEPQVSQWLQLADNS
jgi:hypothetical protein